MGVGNRLTFSKKTRCNLVLQVGGRFLVDASLEEEACSTSRLSLAVNKDGNIVSVTKDGTGGIPYGKMNDIISVSLLSNCRNLEFLQTDFNTNNLKILP